jgi:hypothetical protein
VCLTIYELPNEAGEGEEVYMVRMQDDQVPRGSLSRSREVVSERVMVRQSLEGMGLLCSSWREVHPTNIEHGVVLMGVGRGLI